VNSRDLIRELEAAGWVVARIKGSHHQMVRNGRTITVPHPKKDLGRGLVAVIRKAAGLK
jgi:predicted RNA binding protein YcfA (HicA-like mRNA interferase family)